MSLQWKCLYLYISVFWSFLCFVFLSSLCLTAVYQSVYKVFRKTKTAQTDGSLQSADLRFTPHWLYHRCQTFLTLFYRKENNPPCSHRELRPHTADYDFLNVSPSLTHKLSLWHNLYHMTVICLSLSPSAAETPAACRICVFSSSESWSSGSTPLEVLLDLQISSCDLLKMWVELPASPSTV